MARDPGLILAFIGRVTNAVRKIDDNHRMLIGQACFVIGWSVMWASALALAGLMAVLIGILLLLGGLALAFRG